MILLMSSSKLMTLTVLNDNDLVGVEGTLNYI